jgi:hypothetical protein
VAYDDYRIHRGGSDDGQHSDGPLDAADMAEIKRELARKHNEWLRNGPNSPNVIRVPLWIAEEARSGKYPDPAMKYLFEPKADGPIYSVKRMSLTMGGFMDLKLKGVTIQELRRIGSSSTGALSGTSTMQEKNTLWYDPNCFQRVCHFSYSSQYYGRVLGSGDESTRFELMIALLLPFLFLSIVPLIFIDFSSTGDWRLAKRR